MKRNKSIFVGGQAPILALMLIMCGLLGPAYCQIDDPVLLLQQSPAQGGKITPSTGIHHYDLNADVTLTAVPNPGYQFVYWLGDVSDPTTNSTTVYIDGPKIVIAVFEQVKYEFLVMEAGAQSAPGGRLIPSPADYAQQGFGGGAGYGWPGEPSPPGEEPLPDIFPVPKGEDFPVPIPEPATGLLLVLGSLVALARRRPKKCLIEKAN